MANKRGEAWKRRLGKWDGYDPDILRTNAEPQLWLNVTDPINTDDNMEVTSESSESERSKTTPFQRLTTGQKFKIIRAVVNPISANINKNGSIAIKVKNEHVQALLNTHTLGETPVTIRKDEYRNLIRGVIKDKSIKETPENEIIEELSSINCKAARKIEKPKRDQEGKIMKDEQNKIIFEPNGEVVVTMELESIPTTQIDFFHTKMEISPYEPDPILCRTCYNYGHPKKYCKSKITLCGHCSKAKHCEIGQKCENKPMCRHCHSNELEHGHPTYDQGCPSWMREKEILRIKETQKIPYPVARNILDQRLKESKEKNKAKERQDQLNSLLEANNQAWEARLAKREAELEAKLAKVKEDCEEKLVANDSMWQVKLDQLQNSVNRLHHLLENRILQQVGFQPIALPTAAPPTPVFSTPVRGYVKSINNVTTHIGESQDSKLQHEEKKRKTEAEKGEPPD